MQKKTLWAGIALFLIFLLLTGLFSACEFTPELIPNGSSVGTEEDSSSAEKEPETDVDHPAGGSSEEELPEAAEVSETLDPDGEWLQRAVEESENLLEAMEKVEGDFEYLKERLLEEMEVIQETLGQVYDVTKEEASRMLEEAEKGKSEAENALRLLQKNASWLKEKAEALVKELEEETGRNILR